MRSSTRWCIRSGRAPALRDLADRVGFPLAEHYRPFAKALPGAPTHAHPQLASELRTRRGARAHGGRSRDRPRERGRRRGDVQPAPGVFVLGAPAPRADLAVALDDVRLLVGVARREGLEGSIEVDGFLVELLLARAPDLAARLAERVLGPLEAYAERRSSDLLETLEAFLACELDRTQDRAAAPRPPEHARLPAEADRRADRPRAGSPARPRSARARARPAEVLRRAGALSDSEPRTKWPAWRMLCQGLSAAEPLARAGPVRRATRNRPCRACARPPPSRRPPPRSARRPR